MNEIVVCKRCVMDNVSDYTITFQEDGTCNYCNYALSRKDSTYFPNEIGNAKLVKMIAMIKENTLNDEYDCMMGLSGGLDSSYLAYLGAKEWDLKILAIHIDDGFDTEISQQNIRSICNKYNIDLIEVKPPQKEYMDLIRSFIVAGVPGIANPQDNVLQAYLNYYSKKHKIKYFLSGANFSLESILEKGDGIPAADGKHIKDIHNRFGTLPIKEIKLITLYERFIGQKFINKIETLRPLDLIDYNKDNAIRELEESVGFNYYGGKHYESIFTKFVQVYYLPHKFNIDKRKSHLSSLIVTKQITRKEALNELKKPFYNKNLIDKDINYILEKIKMDKEEFERIMIQNPKKHTDYKTSNFNKFKKIAVKYRKILGE